MNKKGLTLVELVSCISIISVVIVVLFQLIISIQNNQNKKEKDSDTNLTVAMITREIQKDIEAYDLAEEPKTITLTKNDSRNQIIPNDVLNKTENTYYCIEITYKSDPSSPIKGYIIYYQNNNKAFLGYKRGKNNIMETQVVREISLLPEANQTPTITKVTSKSGNIYSLKISLPLGKTKDNKNLVVNYIAENTTT